MQETAAPPTASMIFVPSSSFTLQAGVDKVNDPVVIAGLSFGAGGLNHRGQEALEFRPIDTMELGSI